MIELVAVKQTPVVFVLWGREAQKKRTLITQSHHAVVVCAHPSPLSVRKFFGCRCFSHINRDLADAGCPLTGRFDIWRMLKIPARSRFIKILNVPMIFSKGGSAGGVFPFAKIHCTGERPHEVRSVPPPVSIRLRPCLWNGASWRAGVGWVRRLAFLSILRLF
jgi:hypothetical protein